MPAVRFHLQGVTIAGIFLSVPVGDPRAFSSRTWYTVL